MNKTKFYVALAGFAGVVASLTADGVVDATDWTALAVALVSALGVYFAPNRQA